MDQETIFLHVTIVDHLESIRQAGLKTSESRSGVERVWMVLDKDLGWALSHVYDKYGCRFSYVALQVQPVEVPKRRRTAKGVDLFFVYQDISPEEIVGEIQLGEYHLPATDLGYVPIRSRKLEDIKK